MNATESSNRVEQADDILSKHGGKIALGATALAVYFFYSFYQGGVNRSAVENYLTEVIPLEPYEVQEIRHANKLSSQLFDELVEAAFDFFPKGEASYDDFINFVLSHTAIEVHSGHLLDRVVAKFTESRDDKPTPLLFLLVAFQMTVQDSAEKRMSGLYKIGLQMSQIQGNNDISGNYNGNNAHHSGTLLTIQNFETIVRALMESCQVPVEKQVTETGVKYPFKTYRPKTANDLVTKARTNMKPPVEIEALTESQFKALLATETICLWGECYKDRN